MTAAATAPRVRAPEDRGLRQHLYRLLARELATTRPPGAVLLECSTERPVPEITVRPPELLQAALIHPTFRTATEFPPEPASEPQDEHALSTVCWTLAPLEGSPAYSAGPGVGDAPEAAALLGPAGRLEFQTFWLSGRSDGRLWVARRVRFFTPDPGELDARSPSAARFAASEWSRATGVLCRAEPQRPGADDWPTGSSRSIPRKAWLAVPAALAERTAEPMLPERKPAAGIEDGHTVALGASGAGKTTYLAEQASEAIRRGEAVLAIDLHGDLAPAIVSQLTPAAWPRIVAVDASRRPVVGVAALAGRADLAAAQFVAAVKRLSPDGTDIYWGFRLERIFDSFVRLVQEQGGTLTDLYALLTDADRRDAARLATREPELARFLEELGPIVRRTPEFLWAAASRLAKVVLVPELAELLAPQDGGVPVEELLDGRRSLLVRIPFTTVGPEAAAFAGSLVLARSYLGLAGRRGPVGRHPPVTVVLDEVQGLSPKLVAEMLTEGRKFGLRLLLASQYPERLAAELRFAAAGVSRRVVAFRVPRAGAAEVGGWIGLPTVEAQHSLPELPVGFGLVREPGSGELRTVVAERPSASGGETLWNAAVERSLAEFPTALAPEPAAIDEATERLLLAILAAEEQGAGVPSGHLTEAAMQLPGPPLDRVVLDERAPCLPRSGLAHEVDGTWHLSPSGERRLGLRPTTGASRESDEHRALLLRAFRLFARHGHRLEIVRQGRYDTTLPDAIFRQIPQGWRAGGPAELASAVDRARRGWAWRFFGGRDVHVEAEVSGALRPARLRHGLGKARARGAFALFVVADASRAARVRRTLRTEGLGPSSAQVWTLPPGRDRPVPARAREGKPAGDSPTA
jgi:hypothetical protein